MKPQGGNASVGDRLFAAFQRLLPTRLASSLVHRIALIEQPMIKNALIRAFMRGFAIRLDEAERPRGEDYPHFNAFFTRALKPGARPQARAAQAVSSPADGQLSSCGRIADGQLLQAKGQHYSLQALLGGRAELARMFNGGDWCTIYLAPYNYHRLHMPLDGRLTETLYVPGRLFSVNAATARAIPGLFARNERVIALFDTPAGPVALVLVGALFVGSVETVWAGLITPPHRRGSAVITVPSPALSLARGAEFARFNMGSTIIVVGSPGALAFAGALAGQPVKVGQSLGRWTRTGGKP